MNVNSESGNKKPMMTRPSLAGVTKANFVSRFLKPFKQTQAKSRVKIGVCKSGLKHLSAVTKGWKQIYVCGTKNLSPVKRISS